MSRKNRGGGLELGRAIMKDRNRGRRKKVDGAESWLHSSELSDGYDWNQLNLKSVTEESRLNEFLATAELAGTEFTAEKLNIRVIDPTPYTGLPTVSEREEMEQAQEEHLLSIPRRPSWDASTTAEQLELRERESFLTWRRNLAQIQEDDRLVLTPFERNLQFWRQLWRVVERSDIVVQIVDARNPLLFRCEDLEKYVCEVDPCKVNMLLVSKADLLTQEKRKEWSRYFTEHGGGITVAFWSALEEAEREKEIQDTLDQLSSVELETSGDAHPVDLHTREGVFAGDGREGEEEEEEGEVKEEDEDEDEPKKLSLSAQTASEPDIHSSDRCDPSSVDISAAGIDPEGPIDANPAVSDTGDPSGPNAATSECSQTAAEVTLGTSAVRGEDTAITTDLLTSQELLDLFLAISPVQAGKLTTVGLVGYPNVGKSSTINTLFRGKKVPVSDTPGRTKHFQTLYVSDHLMLCDCPGLVFPSFVTSKAEMVCSGILPIDQMRDHIPPVSLVCHRIARPTLERTYGIQIAPPREGEDPTRPPYAHELLEAYGYMRGYMTAHGMPDCPRSARYILKDYVNGRLLYCHPPPGVESEAFNSFPTQLLAEKHSNGGIERKEEGGDKEEGGMEGKETFKSSLSEFDQGYFREEEVRAVSKGVHGTTGFVRKSGYSSHHAPLTSDLMKDESVPDSETASYVTSSSQPPQDKPWKKHFNRNKKQKTRRLVPYY